MASYAFQIARYAIRMESTLHYIRVVAFRHDHILSSKRYVCTLLSSFFPTKNIIYNWFAQLAYVLLSFSCRGRVFFSFSIQKMGHRIQHSSLLLFSSVNARITFVLIAKKELAIVTNGKCSMRESNGNRFQIEWNRIENMCGRMCTLYNKWIIWISGCM